MSRRRLTDLAAHACAVALVAAFAWLFVVAMLGGCAWRVGPNPERPGVTWTQPQRAQP